MIGKLLRGRLLTQIGVLLLIRLAAIRRHLLVGRLTESRVLTRHHLPIGIRIVVLLNINVLHSRLSGSFFLFFLQAIVLGEDFLRLHIFGIRREDLLAADEADDDEDDLKDAADKTNDCENDDPNENEGEQEDIEESETEVFEEFQH